MDVAKLLPPEALEEARLFCIDEYRDYLIYKKLAEEERNQDTREVLRQFAEQEYRHYEFWKSIAGECRGEIPELEVTKIRILRRLFGLTFALKYLEMHESEVIANYKRYLNYLEGDAREALEDIINDELQHESTLLQGLNEGVVRYLSFIALGLADAIVEITGVHAGFLGATKETLVAGIAGLIVGVSAAISMAGAAYLQAKAEVSDRRPGMSAWVTGVSYLAAVIALALPYFLTQHQLTAFIASVVLAVFIISGFTYYNAVLSETPFRKEIMENLFILFGTATVAYVFGNIIGSIFGLEGIL